VRHLDDMLEELGAQASSPPQGELNLVPREDGATLSNSKNRDAIATEDIGPRPGALKLADEKMLHTLRNRSPRTLDELSAALDHPPAGELAGALTRLELSGRVRLAGTEVYFLR
jgi:hypothetical protein